MIPSCATNSLPSQPIALICKLFYAYPVIHLKLHSNNGLSMKKLWPMTAFAVLQFATLAEIPARAEEEGAPMSVSDGGDGSLFSKDLSELMNMTVSTASSFEEPISEAPATVIVITKDEMKRRGYKEVSEVLNDLPGMDIVRPLGDTYLKNYWRGFRNTAGDPYLVLIDGVNYNHLYYNHSEVPLVTFPISNIERIEVVYGPASAIYGANATNGVINVITRKDIAANGVKQNVTVLAGTQNNRIADANLFYKSGEFRIALSARVDDGDLDTQHTEDYEYSKNKYAVDPAAWHGFLKYPNLASKLKSPHNNRSLDFRAYFGNTEVAFNYMLLSSGYGLVYATDKSQANGKWVRPDTSMYVRHTQDLSKNVTATTLIRSRTSNIDNDSYYIDSYGGAAEFSYWQMRNSSMSALQDFKVKFSENVILSGGFKYENKDLQKGAETPYGKANGKDSAYTSSENLASDYTFPPPPVDSNYAQNRVQWEDEGVYLQGKVKLSDAAQFNLGARNDHNSAFGTAKTFRGGYIGNFGKFELKALYGQAFQEPTPRALYFNWAPSSSNPNIGPEKSNTTEVRFGMKDQNYYTWLSAWQVRNKDTFIVLPAPIGATNLGDRTVTGIDYHATLLTSNMIGVNSKVWVYYSHLFKADEQFIDTSTGKVDGTRKIGDLAYNKYWLGLSLGPVARTEFTLRGRMMGARETIASNPMKEVPAYSTWDMAIAYKMDKVTLTLSGTNLLDKSYSHPGVRDADAGNVPGGTTGYYNSYLPQPGRQFFLAANMEM